MANHIPEIPQTEAEFKLHEALLEMPPARGGSLMNAMRGGESRVIVQENHRMENPGQLVDVSQAIVVRNAALNSRQYGRKRHQISIAETEQKLLGTVPSPNAVKIATIPVPIHQPMETPKMANDALIKSMSTSPVGRASPVSTTSPYGQVASEVKNAPNSNYILYWDIPGLETKPFMCDDATVDDHMVIIVGLSDKLPIPPNGVADLAICDERGVIFKSPVKNTDNHTRAGNVEILLLRRVQEEAPAPASLPVEPVRQLPPSPFSEAVVPAVTDPGEIHLEPASLEEGVDKMLNFLDNLNT